MRASRRLVTGCLAALLALAPLSSALAAETVHRPPGPFDQGRTRIGLAGGAIRGSSGDLDFYIAGGFGYYVVDNLEVGADLAFWFGDTPFYAQLGPTARYVVPLDAPVKPYLGVFYRHWFVSGPDPDADTLGARLGILIQSRSVWLTLGLAYEAIVSECSGDCDDFYPELGLSFVF